MEGITCEQAAENFTRHGVNISGMICKGNIISQTICTIKMIDLLIICARGDRLPHVIEINDRQYTNVSRSNRNIMYQTDDECYLNLNKLCNMFDDKICTDTDFLNIEVSIIKF